MSRAEAPVLSPAVPAAVPESEPALEEGSVPLPRPVPCQPVRRDLGKVPKWLKLPGRWGLAGTVGSRKLSSPCCLLHSQQEVSC